MPQFQWWPGHSQPEFRRKGFGKPPGQGDNRLRIADGGKGGKKRRQAKHNTACAVHGLKPVIHHPAQIARRRDQHVIRRAIGVQIKCGRGGQYRRASDDAIGLLIQHLAANDFGFVPEKPQSKIGAPLDQGVNGCAPSQRQDRKPQARGVGLQPLGQCRDQNRLFGVHRGHVKDTACLCRIKITRSAQSPAQDFNGRGNRLFQGKGCGRGFHSVGKPQKQLIPEDVPQPLQGLADSGLRQAQILCHSGCLPVPQQAKEHQKQGQIQSPDFVIA